MTPLKLIALVLTTTCLQGCMSVSGASSFCAVAQPITWGIGDTPETILQIDRHNAAWIRLCD